MSGAARALLTVVFVAPLSGCATRYEKNWDKLRAGMDRLEVYELLGEPTRRAEAIPDATTSETFTKHFALKFKWLDHEWWAYGPRGLYSAFDSMFIPSPRAHVVVFNADRRLVNWRGPVPELENNSN